MSDNLNQDVLRDAAISRRAAVGGVGVVAIAGAGLTGCAGYGGPNTPDQSGDQPGDQPDGTVLGNAEDVPVGGGAVFEDAKVVVTQPAAGEFKGFSAVCTHQGCLVNDVSGGTINCPCHGSKFAIADGSVANGPAPVGLPAKRLTVAGDQISLA